MNDYLYQLQTSDNVIEKASTIYGKINQYKIQNSSPVIDDADCFDQVGNIFEEHQHTSFNSDLIKKLHPQIKSTIAKKDCSVGIKFINIPDVYIWYPNGDLHFTWSPERKMVYNVYTNYFVNSKNRIYFQTNEGHCFILNKSDVELKYNL